MNTTAQTPGRGLSSRCSAFADLLPLLDSPGLDAEDDAAIRAHLSSCAACQAQRAAYYQMSLAARRSLSPSANAQRHQTEELLASILEEIPAAAPETGVSSTATNPIRLRRPIRPRHLIAGLAPLAAVVVIVVVAATLFASHPRPGGKTGISPQTPKGPWSQLRDISMVSADEGWAAGGTGFCIAERIDASTISLNGDCEETGPLLMHYHSGKWSAVALAFKRPLNTISMLSATDGWAGGDSLFLHYDGHAWQQAPVPTSLKLDRLHMLSDSDGWAIGSIGDTQAILHYDGQTWTPQPLPASLGITKQRPIQFNDLTMISPTEGWVVGTLYTPGTLNSATPTPIQTDQTAVVLHYANGQWTVQSATSNAAFDSISMSSAADGWAVGSAGIVDPPPGNGTPTPTSANSHPFLLHYAQGQWTEVTTFNNTDGNAWAVSMDSASDGWAVGPDLSSVRNGSSMGPVITSLLHYNGQQWTPVHTLAFQNQWLLIMDLHMLSATEGWAVGTLQTDGSQPQRNGDPIILSLTTLIVHYHNGAWSIVPTS